MTKRGSRRCARSSWRCAIWLRPGLDDKVLADWNRLMIAALVNAGVAFDEPRDRHGHARLHFVARDVTRGTNDEQRLGHSWRERQLLFRGWLPISPP